MTEKHVEKGIHKNSNLAESEALDDEFIKVLKGASRPRLPKKAPDWVKKNVINNYKKQHKYLILWYDVKVKFTEYKEALFGTGRGLEIALASTIILLILGGITYYQYTKPQIDSTKTIANQKTPVIKATSRRTNTPIANPKIAINPTNNENNIKQDSNNTHSRIVDGKKDDETNGNVRSKPKNNEPIEIAKYIPRIIERSELNSISSIEKVFVSKFSLDIHTQDIKKQLWLDEIRKGLIEKIPSLKGEEDWKVINNVGEAEVSLEFNEKENTISLVNSDRTDIWVINIKDYFMESPKTVINKIFNKLQEDIVTDFQKNNDKSEKN